MCARTVASCQESPARSPHSDAAPRPNCSHRNGSKWTDRERSLPLVNGHELGGKCGRRVSILMQHAKKPNTIAFEVTMRRPKQITAVLESHPLGELLPVGAYLEKEKKERGNEKSSCLFALGRLFDGHATTATRRPLPSFLSYLKIIVRVPPGSIDRDLWLRAKKRLPRGRHPAQISIWRFLEANVRTNVTNRTQLSSERRNCYLLRSLFCRRRRDIRRNYICLSFHYCDWTDGGREQTSFPS